MAEWIREKGILIPTVPGTWKSLYTANADFLSFNGKYLMYYRGTDCNHDRVGVMTCAPDEFDGVTWHDFALNPIIDVGQAGSFDAKNILDPSAAVFHDHVFLYYSAIGDHDESNIGLAISSDGFSFSKLRNPVISGRCPEVIVYNDKVHLFWVRPYNGKGYAIFHAVSADGIRFHEDINPILTTGNEGDWDSYSVTTPRIFRDENLFYMVYAGDDSTLDDSWRFGLAVSKNLMEWKKYSGNPIFQKGSYGDWDDSNIWFGTVEHIDGRYWMWYEGCNHRRGYDDFISVVGTAKLDAPFFYVNPEDFEEK